MRIFAIRRHSHSWTPESPSPKGNYNKLPVEIWLDTDFKPSNPNFLDILHTQKEMCVVSITRRSHCRRYVKCTPSFPWVTQRQRHSPTFTGTSRQRVYILVVELWLMGTKGRKAPKNRFIYCSKNVEYRTLTSTARISNEIHPQTAPTNRICQHTPIRTDNEERKGHAVM